MIYSYSFVYLFARYDLQNGTYAANRYTHRICAYYYHGSDVCTHNYTIKIINELKVAKIINTSKG